MKKTIFLLLFPFALAAQTDITVQDDAKVGVIVTGTGNTINTTQIFGKSPEYAELKKRLDDLENRIKMKAEKCGKYTDPVAKDDCRAELIALNAERDSVQKIETRFREDVIRLAETFSRIEINTERLRLAKKFFEEGKISEADNVLKEKDMAATGDAALAVKARNDSVLLQTANEFALKAQLKALKMDYDSAQILFAQSRKYFETVENLWDFAYLLGTQNQSHRAIEYFEKALRLARSESEEATLAMNLGVFYSNVQKMAESEKMYLRSLEIFERLATTGPAQFEANLATTCMNLGVFYSDVQKMVESEKMYLRSLEIYERLAKSNPAQFEPDLAKTCLNLGIFYSKVQKMAESEKMYLRSLEIFERLAKSNPAQFEPYLATTAMNLGVFYKAVQKMVEAEKFYLRSLEIRERLAKNNPAQFEPGLALIYLNLGNFYKALQKMAEAEKMYLRLLEIRERLAKTNPELVEPYLAKTYVILGDLYSNEKVEEAEKMYLHSLQIYERLIKNNPTRFKLELANTHTSLGMLYSNNDRAKEAISILKKGLPIRQKLAEANPAMHTEYLAYAFNNLGFAYLKDGDFSNARDCLEKSQALKSDNSWVFRNWACFFALQNELAKAVENLQKAAAFGYDDPDWVGREKSLDAIRGHSAFSAILQQIEQNKEKKGNYKE